MPDEVARILVADDDDDLFAVIAYNLEAAGFEVDRAWRGDEAERRIHARVPDLLIVELILQGVSGLELCRRLRGRPDTMNLPIIVVSEQNEERDRVGALTIGADDYLAKPFSLAELTARVHALLRRSAFRRPTDRLVIGDLTLEPATRRVARGGRLIHLGPLEYGLLSCTMQRPGQVFSRVQLLDLVWPDKTESDSRTVDVHIGRLRRSLSDRGERDPILTVRGEGYSFDETFGRAPAAQKPDAEREFRTPVMAPRQTRRLPNPTEGREMVSTLTPGDPPPSLLHIVIYQENDRPAAAAFTSRDRAEAFVSSREGSRRGSEQRDDAYVIVETIVDGHAAAASPRE